jgi:serine protease
VRAPEVIRVLKETATRPAGAGWSPELGWGILNGAAAMNAIRAIDRGAPSSKLRGPKRVRKPRKVRLTWSGADKARPKLVPSGVAHYEVYRSSNRGRYRRIKTTTRQALTVRMSAGARYRFYTIAVDKAGNREPVPSKPDLSTRVDRAR